MTLGKPNIFIDVLKISRFVKSPLIANTPNNFVELIQNILEDYETAVETARLISNEFFKSNALQNIKHIYGALKNDSEFS